MLQIGERLMASRLLRPAQCVARGTLRPYVRSRPVEVSSHSVGSVYSYFEV